MYRNPTIQRLCNPLHNSKEIVADVLRLDKVHPVVSGNKWFKLKYHLQRAIQSNSKGILSFGGTFSNHLVALAHACKENNLLSAAMIRGEEPSAINHSLQDMKLQGMELIFVSREAYRHKLNLSRSFCENRPHFYVVPEGGQGVEGINGAAEIISNIPPGYTHIICVVGTGTTLAGIVNASQQTQQVLGISALKIRDQENNELSAFLAAHTNKNNYRLIYDFHFGGYARRTPALLKFMNQFYLSEKIPSDFVYTGKMFYAVEELITGNHFPRGSKLLLIHSGGLQGNRSLPPGELIF